MKEYFTIREIADLFQVPESTLRYWESQGLLSPKHNPDNGYREYSMQSIVEISDIILYRSLSLPVKELQHLSGMTFHEMKAAISRAEDRVENQLASLAQVKAGILKRKEKLETYQRLTQALYAIAPMPVQKVLPFSVVDRDSMQLYLHQACDFVILSHGESPEVFQLGVSVASDYPAESPLWTSPGDDAQYLEFLVVTENGHSSSNDLVEHVSRVKSLGLRPGRIIAKYLLSCRTDDLGEYQDYYHGWIQVS